MNGIITRNAELNDIPFLVDTIIEAEKSGTDTLSYTTVFGLSEEETRKYLTDALMEETDGCELSLSSFLIAEKEGEIAAAISSWVEGAEGVPSSMLKANLLNYVLPKENIEKGRAAYIFLRDLHVECKTGTLQIGLVYVAAGFRGQNLVKFLVEEKARKVRQTNPEVTEMEVQVFGDNLPAIRSYEKISFEKILEKESARQEVKSYLPGNRKILMKRELNNG